MPIATTSDHLPPSLPRNWPTPTPADLEVCPHRVVKVGAPQDYSFHDNVVDTTQYTAANFLPKFLYAELHPNKKLANFFFLVVAGLQCIPQITNTLGLPTTLLPLFLILLVEATFQILVDQIRSRADKEINSVLVSRYDYREARFVDIKCSDIAVGDVLQVKCRSIVPADLVLFAVEETVEPPTGICHVETRSLDGESYLRVRHALNITLNIMQDIASLDTLKGEVVMEHPNSQIDGFSGTIDLGRSVGRQLILYENVVLRGCVVRSSDWVIGLVVNTGVDTKIAMTSRFDLSVNKTSKLELLANAQIKRIIVILLALSLFASIGGTIYNVQFKVGSAWYLSFKPNPSTFFFLHLGYFFVLYASVIPVSLYVSMAIARHGQSFFMQEDLEMYDKVYGPAQVMNMRLNEELGQISHIITDKTGSLTRNVMEFRKASINGVAYGQGMTEIGRQVFTLQGKDVPPEILANEIKAQAAAQPFVTFYCPKYFAEISNMRSAQRGKIQEFFRVLALCHEVMCERSDAGNLIYAAPNPDDGTLVHAAAYFGFRFSERRERFVIIENRDKRNSSEEIEIIEMIPFTSTRRRMSIIVKIDDETLGVYSKGADDVMLSRLRGGQDALVEATLHDLKTFSSEGLRCLVVCSSTIPADRFHAWHKQYVEVKNDYQQMEALKLNRPNSVDELEDIIERDLKLLGITAVEDKLQYGVPNCISELHAAGISTWMTTGDREDCAINVAYSSNILLPKAYMKHVVVSRDTVASCADLASLLLHEITAFDDELAEDGAMHTKPRALIIDGFIFTLLSGRTPDSAAAMLHLQHFLRRCKTVIGFRCAPGNKRSLVQLVRASTPEAVVLAVGDGENDVSMLREAHVGVGIKGQEGLAALNAADYGIAQFRFLSPLIIKHGQRNYVRMAHLVCYTMYKNVLISLSLFWFLFNSAYSGQKYITEGVMQMMNVGYTSLPILAYAVYDMHVSADNVYRFPELYRTSLRGELFSSRIFWGWIIDGFCESIVLSLVPLYTVNDTVTFLEASTLTMLGIVIVANAKMFTLIQNRWYMANVVLVLASVGLLVASFVVIGEDAFFDFDYFHLFTHLLRNISAWLTLLLLLVFCICKDIFIATYNRTFNFHAFQIAAEMDAGYGRKFSDKDVVPEVDVEASWQTSSTKLRSPSLKMDSPPRNSPSLKESPQSVSKRLSMSSPPSPADPWRESKEGGSRGLFGSDKEEARGPESPSKR